MSDRRSRLVALLVAFLAVGLSLAGGWLVAAAVDLPSAPEDYNVVGWEVRHFANKWLYKAGTLLRGGPDEAEKSRRLERFLALNAEIASLERQAQQISWDDSPILEELAARRRERDRLENGVEAVVGGGG